MTSSRHPPDSPRRLSAAILCVSLVLLAAFGALLAGCGNSRTQVVDFAKPLAPRGFQILRYPKQGLGLRAPRNWIVSRSKLPLVATVSSGSAIVALWRFPRTAPPPRGGRQLAQARQALIRLARRRDPTLRVIRSALSRVRGAPAIEIDTFQQIAGERRRVRSVHVFVSGYEIVLEQYAPPSLFHPVDHVAFSPMKRSLRISKTF